MVGYVHEGPPGKPAPRAGISPVLARRFEQTKGARAWEKGCAKGSPKLTCRLQRAGARRAVAPAVSQTANTWRRRRRTRKTGSARRHISGVSARLRANERRTRVGEGVCERLTEAHLSPPAGRCPESCRPGGEPDREHVATQTAHPENRLRAQAYLRC